MSPKPTHANALVPTPLVVGPDAEIFRPIISASPSAPFVIAQLGQSLDGRIATPTGASRWINGDGALNHLHKLRAHVDAVIVGIGTVIADDPLLTVRRVSGRQPARVVIDPQGRIKRDARCLYDGDGVRRIVIRSGACGSAVCHDEDGPFETITLPAASPFQGRTLAPKDIARALFNLGMKKILVEGGASTVSKFIDAGAVDRLHILMAPMILGSGVTGLSLNPITELSGAIRPKTRVQVLDDGDVLFDCELRQRAEG
jgi:diaminohydroxyphosphoribosylaminopyrimidine deaminase / 5-amino-6-(5-phosphoribosylamino)uracil reductase